MYLVPPTQLFSLQNTTPRVTKETILSKSILLGNPQPVCCQVEKGEVTLGLHLIEYRLNTSLGLPAVSVYFDNYL